MAWSGQAVSWNRSKAWSSGESFAAPISWRITCCSRTSSWASKVEFCRMSAEDVDRQRRVLGQDAGVVIGVFDAGRGVQLAADGLDLFSNVPRRPAFGALEGHVLQQVGDAVLMHGFRPRPGSNPDAERRRLQIGHLIGDDRHPVFENRCFYIHISHTPAVTARACSSINRSTTPCSAASTC